MKNDDMVSHIAGLLAGLGEDIARPGLQETPRRVAETYRYLTSGYRQTLADVTADALFEADTDEMVIVKNIELYSLCEHHLLPFIGTCHVGYLPRGKIIGLSKIPRIVDLFARRLQVQELLTKQIAEAILSVTEASGVGVVIEAKHLCMVMRAAEKQSPLMTTSVMLGTFRRQASTRHEFLSLIRPH